MHLVTYNYAICGFNGKQVTRAALKMLRLRLQLIYNVFHANYFSIFIGNRANRNMALLEAPAT